MDYHSKYLKYKEKYINLKKMLGGTDLELEKKLFNKMSDDALINTPDDFFKQLKEIYPSTKHDSDDLENLYDGHQITYGEMEYEGMEKILEYLNNKLVKFNYFIDLGSGRGKLSLQLANFPHVINSVGIELVKERHYDAEKIKMELTRFKDTIKKVIFINDDFNNVKLSKYIDGVTLVWFNNLCFTQELTNKIFNKLINILPPQSIIACSRKYLLDRSKLSKFGTLQVPMSWNKNSTIYLYKIK